MTNTNDTNPINWTDDELNTWVEKKQWLEGWNIKPDASINKRNFAIFYHKNPMQWKQAFRFLNETDLEKIGEGKIELDGKKLFIGVDNYISKDKDQTKYEAHKKYIDIQYVISGEEQMGLTTLDKVKTLDPYNTEKDLAFYRFEGGKYIKANPGNFMIFFPEDVHRPGIKMEINVPVKKLVVKLLIE